MGNSKGKESDYSLVLNFQLMSFKNIAFIFKWAGLRFGNKYPSPPTLLRSMCEFIFFYLTTLGRSLNSLHLAFLCSGAAGFPLPDAWLIFHIHLDSSPLCPASLENSWQNLGSQAHRKGVH